MVAFAGTDPIGVLIGAKRPSATLVHRIAVHPDHLRQGHGHHLLESLGSKLAILGPPRMVAEVPEALTAARALFSASGYAEEAVLTDYVLERDQGDPGEALDLSAGGRFIVPVTIDDLAANALLESHPGAAWEGSVETLTARKDEIAGLAVASDERLEAYLLYRAEHAEIVSLRSYVEDGGARLRQLLARLGPGTFRFPKVHPGETPRERLEMLGFRAAGAHRLYVASARAGN